MEASPLNNNNNIKNIQDSFTDSKVMIKTSIYEHILKRTDVICFSCYYYYYLNRTGVYRCGLFCAVYNAIAKLKSELKVDVFHVVKNLRKCNKRIVSDEVSFNEFESFHML